MYKFLLKPKWLAIHALVVVLVATMCVLANWQWDRHVEREAFNETLTLRFSEPPQPLAEILQRFPDREDAQWRLATVSGTYLEQSTVNVVNVSQDGRAGYDPVTPLEIDGGKIVGQLSGSSAGDQFGLVLDKGSKLTAAVSAAVDALKADGTLAKLQETWLAAYAGAPVLK